MSRIMSRVVVLGGSNHNTLGMVRSLGRMGVKVTCILYITGKTEFCVRFSRYVENVYCVKTLEEGVHILLTKCWERGEKNIVLFEGDAIAATVDLHYDEVKDKFVTFNAKGKIAYWLDKINTFSIAEKCGLSLIKTWNIKGGASIPEDITYPCLLKGGNSTTSTKGDMAICNSKTDLENAINPEGNYLLQEYIKKEYELDVVGLSYNQGEDVFIPAVVRKIRDDITRQSGCILLELTKEYPLLPLDQINQFLRELQYEGIFSIELLYKNGKYYFLEINLRNDGVGYLYTVAGVNYPWLWTLYAKGDLTNELLLGVEVKSPCLLVSFNDFKNMLDGKVSFWHWIRDVIQADAYFIFDWKDFKPFLFTLLIHLRQGWKLIIRKWWKNEE